MDVQIGRRGFMRYGLGLAIATAFADILPGCRNLINQIEKDKKTYPAQTPLGELVRRGYPVDHVDKGDWQTTSGSTFAGAFVRFVVVKKGDPAIHVATYDFVDTNGYVNPVLGAHEQPLGSWKSMTWYDLTRVPVFTVTA